MSEEDQIKFSKERIKSYSEDDLLHLVENICNESDKLFNFKQEFSTFFKQNSINGLLFANYDRKGFGQAVVDYFNNKKLRGSSGTSYTKILNHCTKEFEVKSEDLEMVDDQNVDPEQEQKYEQKQEKELEAAVMNVLQLSLSYDDLYQYDDESLLKKMVISFLNQRTDD